MSFFKKLFGLDEVAPHDTLHTALLTTTENREELMALETLLHGAGIPYECRERGAGSPLKVIAGYTVYSTDVFVRQDTLEAARELLEAMSSPDAEEAPADEGAGSDDSENDVSSEAASAANAAEEVPAKESADGKDANRQD